MQPHMTKIAQKFAKNRKKLLSLEGGGSSKTPHGFLGCWLKNHVGPQGGGGQKCPKFRPHGLWMPLKLYVDNEVYVWSEKQQRIERISSSHQHPGMPFQPVPQKYAKTLLGIDESELQSRYIFSNTRTAFSF